MPDVTLKPGDRVIHKQQPDWGVGEVLSTSPGDKVRVYFVYGGEKLLKNAPLEAATGEQARHPLLDHRKTTDPGKGIRRKTIPEAIAWFLHLFPKGFSDPQYFEQERDYKVKARELMRKSLGPEELAKLIAAKDFETVAERAGRVVNATNLIFPNEKMALRDGLRSEEAKQRFALALNELLYGATDEKTRFEAWIGTLYEMEAPKWTVATYFQYFAHPDRYIFLKPAVTQVASDVCNFEINYSPDLNWLTYDSVQRFARVLRAEIESLEPRDMIDVQSFIWCIAPGTYD